MIRESFRDSIALFRTIQFVPSLYSVYGASPQFANCCRPNGAFPIIGSIIDRANRIIWNRIWNKIIWKHLKFIWKKQPMEEPNLKHQEALSVVHL